LPRIPVDGKKCIEYRITFGSKERKLIEDLATSYRLESTIPSITNILKDATALYAIGVMAEIVFGIDLPFIYQTNNAQELWSGLKDSFQTLEPSYIAERTSLFGGFSNLLDQFFYVVSGGLFTDDRFQIRPDE